MILLNMEKAGHCRIAAVTHCTSNPFGCGCIDAICRSAGRFDMPIGTLKRPGVCEDDRKYNEVIARLYDNRFSHGEAQPDAVRVMRAAVAAHPGLTVVSIGPLGNIADFLKSEPDDISDKTGIELAKDAERLVCMGGTAADGGREFNFIVERDATAEVLETWPGAIDFSVFETGDDVITGKTLSEKLGRAHPAALSYALYSPGGRQSWDLTTVYAAVLPASPLFGTGARGTMTIDDKGNNHFALCAGGRHRIISKTAPKEAAEAELDRWMTTV